VTFGEFVPLRPTGCCAGERTFVHDRRTGATRRIDTGSAFVLPAAISANGQEVAATRQDVDGNSIAIVLRNRVTGRSTLVPLPASGRWRGSGTGSREGSSRSSGTTPSPTFRPGSRPTGDT
jgi:hypothetical protein